MFGVLRLAPNGYRWEINVDLLTFKFATMPIIHNWHTFAYTCDTLIKVPFERAVTVSNGSELIPKFWMRRKFNLKCCQQARNCLFAAQYRINLW